MEGQGELMTDWTSLTYVVVDVEGNGQQPPDLVELAAVPIVGGVIGEPKSWLVRPDLPITHFARKIHGISNEQVEDAPVFASVEADVLKALDAPALIAHNAHVDVGVLQRKLGNWECPEVFDTLKLARRLLPGRETYKLGSLVDEFQLGHGLGSEDQPHRATYDATVTARLFFRLAGQRSLKELRDQSTGGGDDEQPALFH
jgi:DNA polymerase III epsilon subunit-like protein